MAPKHAKLEHRTTRDEHVKILVDQKTIIVYVLQMLQYRFCHYDLPKSALLRSLTYCITHAGHNPIYMEN